MAKPKKQHPPDQHERDLIVRELDRTMLVEAAAGTGKTTSMIARMVALLAAGKCRIDTLAAVTFTRKAAAEIRGRFQLELERAAHDSAGDQRTRLHEALEHIERCFIGTIHSFCSRLLRERPVEANVDVAFQELDEAADRAVRDQAWREHVESLLAADSPIVSELEQRGLKLWQRTRRQDPIVSELEELGLEVAQMGPAFLKMADFPDVQDWPAPSVDMPDLTQARSDLRKYVKHIKTLLPSLPNDPGNDQLMPRYRQIVRMINLANIETPAGLIEVLEQFVELETGDLVQKNWPVKGQGKAELARWNEFTQRHAEPLMKAWREHCYAPVMRAIRPAKDVYDRLRRESNQLNFHDLLLKAAELLRDKPQIRQYFRRRFTHLLVDEFQDTDPIQAEIMLLLTADDPQEIDWQKCRPVDGSLFVVGDPKQSIYRFRRADIVTYTKVKNIISGAGGLIVPLSANFRTVEPVIDWINSTFQGRFPARATSYSPEAHPLQLGRDQGGKGDLVGIQRLHVPADPKNEEDVAHHEAEIIARTIRHAMDSGLTMPRTAKEREAGVKPQARPEDFLVIARTKKRLSVYGQKLQEYGIPHQVTGGSTVNEVAELWHLHACLRAVTRPDDPLALLAVLRSELFGISDAALYDFKRASGVFSFYAPVPDQTPADSRAVLSDAFARLQQYARWLARLPTVSAIEKILTDLGLWALSCTEIDGSLQAGSLGKALELLRATSQSSAATAADLVDHLGEIIEQTESHDGLPARPEPTAPVRVMNLHQAKGLEAPIVFLAYPAGQPRFEPDMHIDRSENRARGYLMVQGERRDRPRRQTLAQPRGWDDFSAEEQRFLDAENDRLLYVAATRTGSQLTISQRANRNSDNPWQPFEQQLNTTPELKAPDLKPPTPRSSIVLTQADVTTAVSDIAKRWDQNTAATYAVLSAKESSLAGPLAPKPRGTGEHGTEWGTVIHILLEAAMSRPGMDLRSLALSSLLEQGLDPTLADPAVETVRAVTRSSIWTRAQASSQRLVEVPFEILLPQPLTDTVPRPLVGRSPESTPPAAPTDAVTNSSPLPTILRGVIDLVFREPAGWVIVDYKTEQVPESSLAELADYYRPQLSTYATTWEHITGEPVQEMGILFTHCQQYRRQR